MKSVYVSLLLSCAGVAKAAIISSVTSERVTYFLNDSPAAIERFDLSTRQWLQPLTLPASRGNASAFTVDEDGIYVSFGAALYRYDPALVVETHLINLASTPIALHTDGKLLFVNRSGSLYARFTSIDKDTNTVIASVENYIDALAGSSIAPGLNKLFGRSIGVSPSDITFMPYTDTGSFGGGGGSPHHGDYPSASRTWVFPDEARVVDNSGTVYSADNLRYIGSFGGPVDQIAFSGTNIPIIARQNELISFTSTLLPAGFKTLQQQPYALEVEGTNAIVFYLDAGSPNGLSAETIPLSALSAPQPGLPANPVGLAYTPESVFLDVNGVVLLFSPSNQSVFRWDTVEQKYLSTIPLLGIPLYAAYSPSSHMLYTAYASGLIRRINLSDPSWTEEPWFNLPARPSGLAAAGSYVFAVDGSGAWNTHYSINPSGVLVSSVDWNYTSPEFVWSEPNQKMYFTRSSSPTDLMWEEINANGTAYPALPQGGIGVTKDSPLHTSSGFSHPVRVSPNGSVVVMGTGVVHDAVSLERQTQALANTISDASWLTNNDLRTVRLISGLSQYQQWLGGTFVPGVVKQYPGTPVRLLQLSSSSLVDVTLDGAGMPRFRILDDQFNVIPPAALPTPGTPLPGAISATSVTLTVSHVQGAAHSLLQRREDEGDWIDLATLELALTSHTDTTVMLNGSYEYRVVAINGSLQSQPSDASQVRIRQPDKPQSLTAVATSSSTIRVEWAAADGLHTHFELQYATSASGPWTNLSSLPSLGNAATQVSLATLASNTEYFVRVRTTNVIGPSDWAGPVSATTFLAPPATPAQYTPSVTWNRVLLNWTQPAGASGFRIERLALGDTSWAALGTVASNTVTYADTAVSPGLQFSYRIVAFNDAGDSPPSSIRTVMIPNRTAPSAVQSVFIRVLSANEIRISWSVPADTETLRIERRTGDEAPWGSLTTLAGDAVQYLDTTVTKGNLYQYRIFASNSIGESLPSVIVSGIAENFTHVWEDDFDPILDSASWSLVNGGGATDGGLGFRGSNALWFGVAGVRQAATVPVSLNRGGYIEFEYRSGNPDNLASSYWDRLESGEQVTVEGSLDGSSWSSMATLPLNTDWTTISIPIPAAFHSGKVWIRWRQNQNSGSGFDTWAIDNARIAAVEPPLPDAPVFVLASASSSSSASVFWVAGAGAAGFRVERSTDGLFWEAIADTGVTQTYFTDTTLIAETWYRYRVRAKNASGVSAPSYAVFVKTLSQGSEWLIANFGTDEPSPEMAMDYVGDDGVANMLKFAFNMNRGDGRLYLSDEVPNKGLPVSEVDSSSYRLRICFLRRKSAMNPGIRYTVEFCSTLDCWEPGGYLVEVIPINQTWEKVVVEDTVSVMDSSQRFVRVVVEEQ